MLVTVISNHLEKDLLQKVELSVVFDGTKTGGKQKAQIKLVRKLVEDGESDTKIKLAKSKLAAVLFNGTFKARGNSGIIEGSGLMILDFDHANETLLAKLKGSKYIYACWLSPSGRGYKALMRIPVVKTDEEYKAYFYAVQQDNTEIDQSGKDIGRLCYFSYDPDLYINEDAEVWTTKIVSTQKNFSGGNATKATSSNINKVGLAISMIRESQVGNRHATMLKVGRLVGGYIAGGELDEVEAMTILQNIIQAHSPDDYKDHTKAFLDGIVHGKKTPLTTKEIEEISIEEKLGRLHFEGNEIMDKADYLYENGYKKGFYLGWKDLDKLYSLHLGSTSYIYSAPHTGKTQFWNECLVNLSIFYGMKHLVFSPETGDATDIFIELAQIYAKKDFTGEFKMDKQEKDIAMAFVDQHFIVIDGDAYDKDLTVEDICMYAAVLESKKNIKFHTVTIDPFNELKLQYGNHRDLDVEQRLKYVRRQAKNNDWHIALVTHVKDQFPIHNKEKGYTYYPIPTARDVAGGQAWYRKGMMMIGLWRPILTHADEGVITEEIEGRVVRSGQLIVQVQKAKPKGRGRLGEVNLHYQWKEHVFKDDYGEYARLNSDKENLQLKTELVQEYPF